MTSKDSKSIYFLTSAESKIKVLCNICDHEVDGVACVRLHDDLITAIVVKCHGKTFGIRISDQLISGSSLSGFVVNKAGEIRPVERISKMEPILTKHSLKLEDAIRQAKEKIYNKIYRNGQWIDPSKFGMVKASVLGMASEEPSEPIGESYPMDVMGRKIIMGDK